MEIPILLLMFLTIILLVIPKKTKAKNKEETPRLSERDEAIGDLILQQVGGAISRLSPTGRNHLIERIKKLPPRENQ